MMKRDGVDSDFGIDCRSQRVCGSLTDVRDEEPPLEILGSSEVYRECGGADYTVTQVSLRDRSTGNRFAVHYASVKNGMPGAVCVAMHEGRLLMARHWRVSTESWEWEFPRGMGKVGESPERTALREFYEETGMRADSNAAEVLQHIHADTGVLKDSIAVVALSVADPDQSDARDWELTNMRWLDVHVIERMIAAGEIVDGITLAAFLIWKLH